MEQQKIVVTDLFQRTVKPISNWHEWLQRWEAAPNLEEMIGMLYCGFRVPIGNAPWGEPKYDKIDRIITYFSLANEWNNNWLPKEGAECIVGYDRNGNPDRRRENQVRQIVAKKAFEMLCHNYLKVELHHPRGGRQGTWGSMVTSERIYPVLQNFFRVQEDRGRFEVWNLPDNYNGQELWEQVINFFWHLSQYVWSWKDENTYHGTSKDRDEHEQRVRVIQERLDTSKPWLIEVLNYLNKLNALADYRECLEEPSLAKLREIALRTEISVTWDKKRPVETIEEACYCGSPAAWFLKRRELMVTEGARLAAIQEAERQKAEADRRLQELTNKK